MLGVTDARDSGSVKRTVAVTVVSTPVAPAVGRTVETDGALVVGDGSMVKSPFPTPKTRSKRKASMPIPVAAGPTREMSAVHWVEEFTVVLWTVIPGFRKETVMPGRKFVPVIVTVIRCPTVPRLGVTEVTVISDGAGELATTADPAELMVALATHLGVDHFEGSPP